jgi:hypothetical protein
MVVAVGMQVRIPPAVSTSTPPRQRHWPNRSLPAWWMIDDIPAAGSRASLQADIGLKVWTSQDAHTATATTQTPDRA